MSSVPVRWATVACARRRFGSGAEGAWATNPGIEPGAVGPEPIVVFSTCVMGENRLRERLCYQQRSSDSALPRAGTEVWRCYGAVAAEAEVETRYQRTVPALH